METESTQKERCGKATEHGRNTTTKAIGMWWQQKLQPLYSQLNNGSTLSDHANNISNNNNINSTKLSDPKIRALDLQTPQSKFLSASFPPMRLNLPDECVYIDDDDGEDNDEFASPAEPTIERLQHLASTGRGELANNLRLFHKHAYFGH